MLVKPADLANAAVTTLTVGLPRFNGSSGGNPSATIIQENADWYMLFGIFVYTRGPYRQMHRLMAASFYWYDLETTGVDPARDRPVQFAGIRTDLELNVIGTPASFCCRLPDDILPDPEAMLVTRLSARELSRTGLTEVEFIRRINEAFSEPGSCVIGFNNLRFDDEFIRNTLYRNFRDPYAREWQGENSRWDIIDLVRMACALRPDGIEWPMRDGVPSFKLLDLTASNGIEHEDAHDALSDVKATVSMARLVRKAQPKLFRFLFELRRKQQVLGQLYPIGKSAIVHASSMYPAEDQCIAVVLPICSHPQNQNGVICYDLSEDPTPLIESSAEEVNRLVFTPRAELPEDETRIPLRTMHVNRCPAIAPLATLRREDSLRLGIDVAKHLDHMRRIQRSAGIVEKIQLAISKRDFPVESDPDLMLYSGGFFSPDDRDAMTRMLDSSPVELQEYSSRFRDPRMPEMLFRYRARNFPETLNEEERSRWNSYRLDKWQGGQSVREYFFSLEQMISDRAGNEDVSLLLDLKDYVNEITRDLNGGQFT